MVGRRVPWAARSCQYPSHRVECTYTCGGGVGGWEAGERMAAIYRRVLGILADLEHAGAGTELDEFSLAVALDLVPATMPPFAYTMSPARGELLRVLTALEASKCIYATKNGFWRLRLTAAGRRALAAPVDLPVTDGE